MPTRTKHMDEIAEELDTLREEVGVLSHKQDQIQDQINQVNTRLLSVESLEKQLGKVELLVEKNAEVQQEIFSILRTMRSEKPDPPAPESSVIASVTTLQNQNQQQQ